MPRKRSPEAQALFELKESLTARLEAMHVKVLERAGTILGRTLNVHAFHGIIGGKNNTFVDSVRTKFTDPKDFKARWLRGLMDRARPSLERGWANSAVRIARLLQDPLVRKYTMLFLERNFYRELEPRTRDKPDESLWRLWFGVNQFTWGLLIAPVYRNEEWTNDLSEIRRTKYKYWTVEHVLQAGLIDPESDEPYTFEMPGDLTKFYRSILKRVSNSQYEKAIADRYIKYLEESDNRDDEPFLVPELRYAGLEKEHRHRLDYSILNPHTMEFVGFELSPFSTHGAIKGMASKSQTQVNREGAARWAREMNKRNAYFADFGITTVTFTDDDLADMDGCFDTMRGYLERRAEKAPVLSQELQALGKLDFGKVEVD